MLGLLHYGLLNGLWLHDRLKLELCKYWWHYSTFFKTIVGKRPKHVLLVGDNSPTREELKMLINWCQMEGISRVTLLYDHPEHHIDYLCKLSDVAVYVDGKERLDRSNSSSLTVNVKSQDQLRAFAKIVQSSQLPFEGLPSVEQIDLAIVTRKEMSLSGLPALSISFAEIAHYPDDHFISLKILKCALWQYTSCRQNYGK